MRILAVILALAFFITAGAGLLEAQGIEDLLPRGKEIFDNICADCHRLNGEGLPHTFPALNNNPFVKGDPAPVIATVLNGRKGKLGQMPYWKEKLSDRDIAGAITYIRQAWSNRAPPVTPEMVKAIRGK